MNPRQYKPYTSDFKTIPRIVYPVKDENPLQDIYKNEAEITAHLDALYAKHAEVLNKGSYHILFVWNLEGHRMTDVWIHDMKNWSDSGPLLECVTFRDLETCEDAGIASGDSIIVLGREEELRRTLPSLKEYVDRFKYLPAFPVGMQPVKQFGEMSKPRIVIVNENDKIIGHKERGTLVQSDIYRVSALWVKNSKGDILLAQRKFTKSHDPGKWGPAVAGTVEEGETYEQNIIKEVEEEIGLKNIKPIPGPKVRTTGDHNYFGQWFTLTIDKPAEDFTTQEDEVEQVKWFTRAELEKELHEHPEKYLESMEWPLENL